ncbi:hypothetical protein Tco_1444717 [Tanacetum coccineum]
MSTLKFAETHNLVAFLDKPEESKGFEQIIDFLNASSIRYALTVNLTIYTSCIKQFWATAKVQTDNEEVQIQALVDGKKVIITETNVRRALHLKDAKGIDCLPTATIFAELERIGVKIIAWNKFSSTMAFAIICLATNQIFNFYKYIVDNMVKNLEGGVKFLMYPRVLALENTNTSQVVEIATLKERVKKLEKKRMSRTYKPRRLYKGRKIANLDADTEVTLIDETQGRNDEDLMFDTGVLNGDEVFQEPIVNTATTTSLIPVSAADPVTTAGEVVTTASVEIPEELTLAQTLIEIKIAKPKAVITAATTVTPANSRPKAKGIAKDKGKAKMVEPEKPLKKKDQIAIDEEVARNLEAQLQAELEEEERLSRQKEEEANIALIELWDNTQAMMDADFQLAQQMQTEEQEQLSIEEKSKLFVELLKKRKKHFAALRA